MTTTFALAFSAAAGLAASFVCMSGWKALRGNGTAGTRADLAWSMIPLVLLVCLGVFLLSHG